MSERWDAIVVGSGPNGLAAAITLAQADRAVLVLEAADTIGGGLRSDELEPGLVRDRCAAVMPFAVGSPFLSTLPLADHGVQWVQTDVAFTHPLDQGRVGVAHRSLTKTVEQLHSDGERYRRLVGPIAQSWFDLADEVMAPMAHLPRHPIKLARYGITGMRSAASIARRFQTPQAQALLAGCAAHSVAPLTTAFTGAVATLFCASAHANGWPVVSGGSQRLADAMGSLADELGVEVRTGHRIVSMEDLEPHRAVLFDTDPLQLERIAGRRLPDRYRNKLRNFGFGPGVFKIDHVLDGPVPWADPHSPMTSTVHVGGTLAQVAAAEADVAAGRHPDRPFVLVAQQSAADRTRSPDHRHVLWSYTHVPNGSDVDMTAAIEAQIERFAPGFSDRILARHTTSPGQLSRYNANCVGGDISGGAMLGRQLFARPRLRRPYSTPDPSIFLCSASTPPGGGVHAMCGHNAAKAALAGILG